LAIGSSLRPKVKHARVPLAIVLKPRWAVHAPNDRRGRTRSARVLHQRLARYFRCKLSAPASDELRLASGSGCLFVRFRFGLCHAARDHFMVGEPDDLPRPVVIEGRDPELDIRPWFGHTRRRHTLGRARPSRPALARPERVTLKRAARSTRYKGQPINSRPGPKVALRFRGTVTPASDPRAYRRALTRFLWPPPVSLGTRKQSCLANMRARA
jgi:hypothetical protein